MNLYRSISTSVRIFKNSIITKAVKAIVVIMKNSELLRNKSIRIIITAPSIYKFLLDRQIQ